MNKIKTEISKIYRGYRLIAEIDGTYLAMVVLNAITDSVFPFFNLYMSSLFITEISSGRRINTLIYYAVITAAVNLLLSMINQIIITVEDKHAELFICRSAMYYSDVNNNMLYEYIEKPETKFKRGRISDAESYTGAGLRALFNYTYSVINSIFVIIFSITLTSELFRLKPTGIYTGVMGFIDSRFSLIIIIALVIMNAIFSLVLEKKQKLRSNEVLKDEPFFNRLLIYYGRRIYNYNGAMDIRIFNQAALIENEIKKYYDNPIFHKELARIIKKYGILKTILSVFVNIIIYCYIGVKTYIGTITIGNFLMYTGTLQQFTWGISGIIVAVLSLIDNNKYLNEILEYIDTPKMDTKGKLPIGKPETLEIEFHDVSFKYPETDRFVLQNVNLKINMRERIAVVGLNGSGKSTMIKLICRLYVPTTGKITLNGIDISEYEYSEYLKLFSVVFQDFQLFAFTLGQNVATAVSYDRERVERCLKNVGFGDKYNKLKDGTDTALYRTFDVNGIEISGGEAQKIALARALYKDAPFMILDEPTATLDPISEAEIYEKFNQIIENKTALFISHRLSSCRFCDRIIVFNSGHVVQQGSHDSLLMEKDGEYIKLWNSQAQYYN